MIEVLNLVGAGGSENGAGTGEVVLGLIIFALLFALYLAPGVIAIRKGHVGLGVLGIVLFWPLAVWGALRMARPDSNWAKSHYGPAQIEEARQKYPDAARQAPTSRPLPSPGRTSSGTTVPAGRGNPTPSAPPGSLAEPFPDVGGKPAPGYEVGPATPERAGAPDPTAAPAPSGTVFGSDRKAQAGGWECYICGEGFSTKSEAEMHVSANHRGAPLGSSVGEAI